FDTALASCARAIQPIGAWTIGISTPSISVTRLAKRVVGAAVMASSCPVAALVAGPRPAGPRRRGGSEVLELAAPERAGDEAEELAEHGSGGAPDGVAHELEEEDGPVLAP